MNNIDKLEFDIKEMIDAKIIADAYKGEDVTIYPKAFNLIKQVLNDYRKAANKGKEKHKNDTI